MITARVVTMLGTKPREQIDRLEDLWQRMVTFLEYVPRDEKRNPLPDRSVPRRVVSDEKAGSQQNPRNAARRARRENGPRRPPSRPHD